MSPRGLLWGSERCGAPRLWPVNEQHIGDCVSPSRVANRDISNGHRLAAHAGMERFHALVEILPS